SSRRCLGLPAALPPVVVLPHGPLVGFLQKWRDLLLEGGCRGVEHADPVSAPVHGVRQQGVDLTVVVALRQTALRVSRPAGAEQTNERGAPNPHVEAERPQTV